MSQLKHINIKDSAHYNIIIDGKEFENSRTSSNDNMDAIELKVPIQNSYSSMNFENCVDETSARSISLSYSQKIVNTSGDSGEKGHLIIQFDKSYIKSLAKRSPLIADPLLENIKKGVPFKIAGSFTNLSQELNELAEDIQEILNRPIIMYTLLNAYVQSLLLKSIDLITCNKPHSLIDNNLSFNRGKKLILENLNKYPGQRKIQKAACVNRNYFNQIFKNKIGMNPQKFQIQKRREKAITAIINSKATFTSISNALGYTHPPALTRDIKDEIGMTPKELRTLINHLSTPIK